jgi:beta-glucosidase
MLSHIYITIKLTSGYGGSPFCRGDFQKFADFCFKTYGDRVKNWFTINEPRMMAAHGYSDGFFAPVRCTGCKNGGNSATEPYIAGHHLLLSHASAVTTYREKYQASRHWLTAPSSSSVSPCLYQRAFPD